jgi:ATP-binding cassette subfamily B protein
MAKVEQIFSHFFIDAVACGVLPLVVALFLISLDFKLTGLMVASVLIALPGLWAGQKVILYFGRQHVVTRNQTASRLLEYLQGIKVLKAFNLTGPGFSRLDNIMRKLKSDSIRLEAAAGGPVLVFAVVLELGIMGLVVLGAHLLFQGQLTAPVFCVFLVVGYKFFDPLINFGIFLSEMRYMNIAANRVSEVMNTRPLPAPDHPAVPETHDIAFRDVVFGYGNDPVIRGITTGFRAKRITALVGPSGSGKTTLTSLMARFWDVDSGSITIGSVDIRQIPQEELNAMFSMVFQDVYLFQDTILGNIRVGKKDASRDEVIRAARAAQCHGFIEALPDGYDTLVGEGGATLSGGEKQRISIARALLKDAPIVILDEATAALDPENELLIQEAIGELVRDKTLIVIAHRLATIAGAHRIHVVDQGRIASSGTHDELLAEGGLYAALWHEQQQARGWKFGGAREGSLKN